MIVKKTVFIIIPTCCIILFFRLMCNNIAGEGASINNGKIELGFDKKTGTLLVFRDLVNSLDLLSENRVSGSIWELDCMISSGFKTLTINDALKFRYSKPNPLTIILEWGKFAEIKNNKFKITAIVTLDEVGFLSTWRVSLEGTDGTKINKVVFPRISGIKQTVGEYLAVPAGGGQLTKAPGMNLSKIQSKEKKYHWTYPGNFSLQCLALYNSNNKGIYASCNDSLAFYKEFLISIDTLSNLVYEMNNYPFFDSTMTSYTLPYAAIIGSFEGDWTEAAEIYRNWAIKQKWCKESRFKNKQTPEWLENTGLWIWNRGKSSNVLVPATDLCQRAGLPVSVLWYWWHGCAYDDGFPEYFPPREGKKQFISALSSAQDKGIRAIVYMNSVLWGTNTKSWRNENALFNAAKDSKGEIISQTPNIFTKQPMAYMCSATKFWQEKYSSLCDSAFETYKVNGIYMDMAGQSSTCYDRNHGHPLGKSNYFLNDFLKLTHQIRSSISQKNQHVLGGEGCSELWLPYIDAFLTIPISRERYSGVTEWETIPFFQAVYHQYGITYGNYSSLIVPPYDELWPKEFAPQKPLELLDKNFNKQFLMEQARSFAWGNQPTISNYQVFLASERKEEIGYLIKLAKIRNHGLKYLLYGKFLKSPDINSPEEEFDISMLSIYAGKRGEKVKTFRNTYPLLYSGTWQSDDNQIGIALASISDEPIPITFSLDAKEYGLSSSGKINIIDADGRRYLTSYSDEQIQLNYILQPRGLCIVELTSND